MLKRRIDLYNATLIWNGGHIVELRFDWGIGSIYKIRRPSIISAGELFNKLEDEMDKTISAMA